MEIRYKNKRIRDICENEKKAIKKYNKIIAEKLIFSIEFLKNSNSLKDVADYQNFRLHELKYGRKGQFAIDLDLGKTTGYRLIIEPITVNKKNEIISYESINIVEIMEVSNHYE
ncbi:addiction module toxin RelE [Fusobacterium polymorphum]